MTASSSASASGPNTTMTSIPSTGESPIMDAWKKAVEKYKKSLPEKDQRRIQMPTGPRDVVKDIEEWQQKQSKRKSIKVATVVRNGLDRLQRFTAAIDMLAQGSPAPGCLLWGSIKFILTIVQDAVGEYEKLCTALNRMVECLPWIEIYEKTFVESALIHGCVVDFYESAIHFWTQACKFYRRHRLWKMVRKVWENYDTEFSLLQTKMSNNAEKVKESATAEHIWQAKSARSDQVTVNRTLLNTQKFSRKKDLTRWLSPTAYEIKYYQDDFKTAIKKRHPGSCQWLFNHAQFIQFSRSQVGQAPLLWIFAKPGAGKTVLSSYLIDHYQQQRTNNTSHNVIYFFCKNLDADKNNPSSIIRSLLYQLWEVVEGPEYCGKLSHDMGACMTESGQPRALEFGTMWSLFAAHISKMDQPIVVLDALDECTEPKILIQKLKDLSDPRGIRVIITSRKEQHIHKLLDGKFSLEIRSEDIDADIKAFIKAKISKTPLLCQSSVHDMIVDKLSTTHGGMFLWVYLTLKELKICKFVQQVQATLKSLPEGLDAIYGNILQRLCKSLKHPSLELAKKVFIWVVSASRPLRVEEIKEALISHYRMDGHQLIADEFPYADKDIELACGSLLTIHEGTIQVIHLTVKEFLTSSTDDSYKQLMVDPMAAGLQLTLVCLDYISQNLTTPILDLDAKTNRMDIKVDHVRLQGRREQNPFIEYACLNWALHCIDYNGNCSDMIAKAIEKTFDSSATFYWIEACLLFDSSSFLRRICLGLRELIEWASDEMDRAPSGFAGRYKFLSNWCSVILRIVRDYGGGIADLPWDVYMLDMREIFVSGNLGKLYDDYGNFETREPVTFFTNDHSKTSPIVPSHLQIATSRLVGLFIHDHVRKVFFTADWHNTNETLYVQEVETGRRLPPVVDPEAWPCTLESYAISTGGEYLCILYRSNHGSETDHQIDRISIWRLDSKIEFKKTMRSEPWARKVFSHDSPFLFTTVGYRNDGYFYSPIGRIQPATGIVLPFPSEISLDLNPYDHLCFGANGEVYVHKLETQVLKVYVHKLETQVLKVYSFLEPYDVENQSPMAAKIREIQASRTGRYLLLEISMRYSRVTKLYDTTTKKVFETTRGLTQQACFKFSKDDSRLFCMALYDHPRRVEALVFALNDGGPRICSEVQIELAETCELFTIIKRYWIPLDVCSDEDIAWLTYGSRIYRVDLGPPKISFPQDLIADLAVHYSRISSDGTRLSVLRYGDNKAQIQTFDLTMPGNPVRFLDLNWPHGESGRNPNISFSKDLGVLVFGRNIFHLAAEDRLAIESFPVSPRQKLSEFFSNFTPYYYNNPLIYINDDSPFIAYVTYIEYRKPPSVHKVNLSSRCSVLVYIPSINRISMFNAVLHPSLPLLLLVHHDESEGTSGLILSTLDLNNLNVKCLSIPRCYRELTGALSISFSDCGTVILHRDINIILGSLQIEPGPIRSLGYNHRNNYPGNYSLLAPNRTGLGVYFAPSFRPTGSSDPGFRNVGSGILVSLPSYSDFHSSRILLGPTNDDYIRVLLFSKDQEPLEIRTIRLTFSELRARLIHKWELGNQRPFEAETVEIHPDAAAAYVMERPDGSSSAYLSPSDLITLFPDPADSEDDTADWEDVTTDSEDDTADSEDDRADSEDDKADSEDDRADSEDDRADSDDDTRIAMPLRTMLDIIRMGDGQTPFEHPVIDTVNRAKILVLEGHMEDTWEQDTGAWPENISEQDDLL